MYIIPSLSDVPLSERMAVCERFFRPGHCPQYHIAFLMKVWGYGRTPEQATAHPAQRGKQSPRRPVV